MHTRRWKFKLPCKLLSVVKLHPTEKTENTWTMTHKMQISILIFHTFSLFLHGAPAILQRMILDWRRRWIQMHLLWISLINFHVNAFLWSSAICFYCLFHSPSLIYANYDVIAQVEFMAQRWSLKISDVIIFSETATKCR